MDETAILGALAGLVALLAAVRGTRRLGRGLAEASPLEVVRGLRSWAVAIAAVSLALGVLSGRTGFLWFGAVFLAAELYETAVLAAVLRRGRPAATPGGATARVDCHGVGGGGRPGGGGRHRSSEPFRYRVPPGRCRFRPLRFDNSLVVTCETQDETDAVWAALSAGGRPGPCGWLKDPFGVSCVAGRGSWTPC